MRFFHKSSDIRHIEKLRYEMVKLKNDIIYTKKFRNMFAGECMSVEPELPPEVQPNGKLAEKCFAPRFRIV